MAGISALRHLRTPCATPASHRRGFSALEMVVTVVIGLIMSAIGIAGYQIYQRELPVKYSADRLSRAAAAARTYAVANNSYYVLHLDQRFQNYWIDETDETGEKIVVPKVTTPERIGDRVTLDSATFGSSSASGPFYAILFNPDGSATDARVLLRMGEGASTIYYALRIYGPTGLGQIQANVAVTK